MWKIGKSDDYWLVWIYVFSEPDWATLDKHQKFIRSSYKVPKINNLIRNMPNT